MKAVWEAAVFHRRAALAALTTLRIPAGLAALMTLGIPAGSAALMTLRIPVDLEIPAGLDWVVFKAKFCICILQMLVKYF